MTNTTPAAEPATTADKAAALDMTPTDYRKYRHVAAVEQIQKAVGGLLAETGLRVMDALDGQQPEAEAHRTLTEWTAEVLEADGVWMYLGSDPDRSVVEKRRASMTRRHPDAETRTVRKTTTYTVATEEQPR